MIAKDEGRVFQNVAHGPPPWEPPREPTDANFQVLIQGYQINISGDSAQ